MTPDLVQTLGTPGTDDTLVGILRQIADLQQRPLIAPGDTMGRIGAAMSGMGAGLMGKESPVFGQLQAQRAEQLRALTLSAQVAQMREANRDKEIELALKKDDVLSHRITAMGSFLKPMLESPHDATRAGAARLYRDFLAPFGVSISDEEMSGIGQKPLPAETRNQILKLRLENHSDEDIATIVGRDVATIQAVAKLPDSPTLRASLGVKTKEQLSRESLQERLADMKLMEEESGFENPVTKQKELQTALEEFNLKSGRPGRRYNELTPADKAVVMANAKEISIDLAYGKGFAAAMAAQAADWKKKLGGDASFYIHENSWKPADPGWTKEQAVANRYIPLPNDPVLRRNIGQLRTASEVLTELEGIYRSRLDVFPKSTGNKYADLARVASAWSQFKVTGWVDTDASRIRALKAQIPLLARAAMEVGNLSEPEQKRAAEAAAGFDAPGTLEAKVAALDQSRAFFDKSVSRFGLGPLPRGKFLLDAKGNSKLDSKGRAILLPME